MVELSYKFNNKWTYHKITDDEFIEAFVEFADKYHMVTIDGKNSDVYSLIFDVFGRSYDIDPETLTEYGAFGDFIHDKFRERAFEEYEEEKLLSEE